MLILLSALFIQNSIFAMTLQEAISTTIKENPNSQAKDKEIEAMRLRTKAEWARRLPTFDVRLFNIFSDGESRIEGVNNSYRTDGLGARASITVPIFDGGEIKAGARAAEARQQAQEALYRSTNAFIENTKGKLVADTKRYYVMIAYRTEFINELQKVLAALRVLVRGNTDQGTKERIQLSIDNLEAEIQRQESLIAEFSGHFEFVVTVPPENLDGLDVILHGLVIPNSAEEAIEIAQQKSPEVQARRLRLEAVQQDRKQTKSAGSFKGDLSISKGVSKDHNLLNPYTDSIDSSATVMFTIRKSFGVPQHYYSKAADIDAEAAQADYDYSMRKLKFDIVSIYGTLLRAEEIHFTLEQNYKNANAAVDRLLKRAQDGAPFDSNDLQPLDSQINSFAKLIDNRIEIIDGRFEIQQTTGTLFDNIHHRIFNF